MRRGEPPPGWGPAPAPADAWEYHVSVAKLAQPVLAYIRKHDLLKPGDRVAVAISGGADSVALLCLLEDLRDQVGIVLSAVHFNHRLRGGDSDEDQRFVFALARRLNLQAHSESGDVAAYAREKHLSLETAARAMRYAYFHRLLQEGRCHSIATAHTLDDQAETVLLKLVRGAGTRGLAGVYPKLAVAGKAAVIRPLLGTRRSDIESYLVEIRQPWREDSSNRDLRHSRNRVRHGILPRLERYLNPAVYEALSESAEIARAEEEYWSNHAQQLLPALWRSSEGSRCGVLRLKALAGLPLAVQRRVIRAAGESLGLQLEFRQVEEVLETALVLQRPSQAGPRKSVLLSDHWKVSRKKDELHFEREDATAGLSNYEYRLPVPGSIDVPELGTRFESRLVGRNGIQGYNPQNLFDPNLLAKQLTVRNWRPGDRFWPAHSKAPKKVKELLQDRQVSGTERKLWPVVLSADQIVWLRGFPLPAGLQLQQNTTRAVWVEERPLEGPQNRLRPGRRAEPGLRPGSR